MEKEIRNTRDKMYGKSAQMSKEEKTISFLNRFFVYKKVRDVSQQRIQKIYDKYVGKEIDQYEDDDNYDEEKEKEKPFKSVLRIVPDKKITLSLQNYYPVEEKMGEEEEEEEGEIKEKEEEYGEYQSFYDALTTNMKDKISNYTKEKQIDILKKLKKQQQTKIVVAKK
jgi:hypothetical protein